MYMYTCIYNKCLNICLAVKMAATLYDCMWGGDIPVGTIFITVLETPGYKMLYFMLFM